MSIAGSQQRTLLELLTQLRPHWHRDRNLPARIQNLLARQRAFGARDRRLYRELIYTTLRYLPWVERALDADADWAVQLIAWLAADSPATDRFRTVFVSGWPPCPPTVAEKTAILAERFTQGPAAPVHPPPPEPLGSLLPEWFRTHCPEAFTPNQTNVLLARAPLWLRLQTNATEPVIQEFADLGWQWTSSGVLDSAWRVDASINVTKSRAYEEGLIEIQDLGSQLLLESCAIVPGEHWLDACAGAGGKTLQLAGMLGSKGRIDASDVRADALRELAVRAKRAGIPVARDNEHAPLPGAQTTGQSHKRFARLRIGAASEVTYDGVLVDAPCSGSGTWRRAPHLKWTTQPSHIEAAAAKQRELLSRFGDRVRPGGRLIYATCSLSHRENQDVVAAFLETRPDFTVEPAPNPFGGVQGSGGLTFLPALHDTDGFFVSCLRRRR